MNGQLVRIFPFLLAANLFFQACIPSLNRSVLEGISALLSADSPRRAQGDYLIKFTVSGLVGTGMVVRLNSDFDSLTVDSNGEFTFSKTIRTGSTFEVTIQTQPTTPPQTCSVSGGTGTVGTSDVESILVNCDPLTYALTGTIAGIDINGTGLLIENTIDGTTMSLGGPGTFSFNTAYPEGTNYNVVVVTQPNNPLQNCLITNPSGTFLAQDVTDISITCTTLAYPINVEVVGLSPLTTSPNNFRIQNNANEILPIAANGTYTFPTNIPPSERYNLRITQTPPNHTCVYDPTSPNPETAMIAAAGVTVRYNCFSLILADSSPKTGSVLRNDQSLRLVFTSPVDNNSCTAGGGSTFGGTPTGTPEFSVDTTNFTDDTLVVSPDSGSSSTWMTGFRELNLNCTTTAGGHSLSSTTQLFFTIPSTIRFVSTSGSDAFTGGESDPFANISFAITDIGACPTGDCAVLIEQGVYESNGAGPDEIIQMANGVSLFGGYQTGSTFSVRDPDTYTTEIRMTTPPTFCATSTLALPCSIIYASNAITVPTTISGLRIAGYTGVNNYTAGVSQVNTNSLFLIDNEISGGNGVIASSGLSSVDSSPVLVFNSTTGGQCSSNNCITAGVRVAGSVAMTPNLKLNTVLKGGTCANDGCTSAGMFVSSTGSTNVTSIQGNYFLGGDAGQAVPGSRSVGYLHIAGNGGGALFGNILEGGTGNQTSGIRIEVPTTIAIGSLTQGNLIRGGTSGFRSASVYLATAHTVANNEIRLGNVTATGTASNLGVYILTSSQDIDIARNFILDGTTSAPIGNLAESYGIFASALTNLSTINSNYIRMGTITQGNDNSVLAGIKLTFSQALSVRNNQIIGGTSTGHSNAIHFENNTSALQLYHNTMNSGTTTAGTLGRVNVIRLTSNSGGMHIQNNIVMLNTNSGTNTCISKNSFATFGSIFNNNLFGCANMVFDSVGAITYTTLCPLGVPGIAGCGSTMGAAANYGSNVILNPNLTNNFGTTSNFVPTVNTPCAVSQTTNALITNSITGAATRPGANATYSMGAYEYDGTCVP